MRAALAALIAVVTLAAAPVAQAAGCLKGAVIGGLAGHLVHHGVVGAAAGCAIGHHEAAKHERERAMQARQYRDDPYNR